MDTSQPSSLPPSLPAGPFPGWRTATRAAAAGSEALVDAVPPRASPPSAGRPRSSRLRGAPSAPAQCPRRGAGLRFLSAAAAVAAATVSFRRGEARNGPVGSPPPFPRPEPPLLVRRDLVPVEFPFHPAAVSSVLGPVEVTALEEEAAAAALASSPPVRCPRSRRGGAAATAAPPPPAALGPGWVELRCPRTSSHCSART